MSSADPPSDAAPKVTAPSRRRYWRRHGLPSLLFSLLFAGLVGFVLYLMMGRPVAAPAWLRAEVEARVAASFDQAALTFDTLDFVVEDTASPRVRMTNVRVLSQSGTEVVGFAELRAGLSLSALLTGQAHITQLSVSGVFANLRRIEDGTFVLSGGYDLGGPTRRASSVGALIEEIDTLLTQPGLRHLEVAEVRGLTLRLEDVRLGRAWTVDGARVQATRADDTLRLTADLALLSGGTGVATLAANYQSAIGTREASFGATVTDVAAEDISALAAPFEWLEILRAPISGAMRGGVAADGSTAPLSVTFSIGAGVLQPTEATRPIPFDAARSYFNYDPATGVMGFDELSVQSDWITASIDGQAVLNNAPDGTLENLVGQFKASSFSANPDDFYAAPITLDAAHMDFRLRLDPFRLEMGQAYFEDQGQALLASGQLVAEPEGWRFGVDAQMDGLAPERLFALWPDRFIPKSRAWAQENILAGQLSNLDFSVRDATGSAPTVYLSFDYDEADVRFMRTLPPVTGAQGSASLLADRFVVTVDQGTVTAPQGGAINVGGTSFIIPDVTVKGGAPGVARVELDGLVPAALSLLDQPPFNIMAKAGLSPDVAQGQLQASGTISLPLRKGIDLSEVQFDASGTARGVESTTLVEGRTLAADTLRVVADDTGVVVSGPGTLDGIPFVATWTQTIAETAQPSQVRGTVEMSQAANAAFNIGLPNDMLRGAAQADLVLDLPVGGGVPRFALQSDLRGLGLSSPPLGWRKAAGGAGALTVEGTLGATPQVDRLVLDTPGLRASGAVSLSAGGGLERARFDRVQVGAWLDAPVELFGRGVGVAPAVEVQGGTLDLRQADFGGSSGSSAGQDSGPLSLALDRLQITDTIALNGLRGDFKLSGGLDGAFTARVNGGAAISGQIVPQNGRSAVRVRSEDAGGVFASAGLLKQAREGDLSLTLLPVGEASFDGTLQVQNTRVQDAPAIAALLNALSVVGLLEQMGGNGIHFQQVEAAFRLTPSTMALTQASAVGPSMGLSMDGTYNVQNGALDMQGVVSPLYLVNGIGSLFTRKGEGLIGFNYRLQGPAQSPSVSVNPLSALTPGFFREIFRAPPPKVPQVEGQGTVPGAFVDDAANAQRDRAEERRRRLQQEIDER